MEKIWINIPDVLFFQEGPGVRNTQYTTEGVKLLNVANLVDGKVDLSKSDRYISEDEAYGKYKHFLCDAGDFVIASSGIKVEYIDKKMGFVDESMLPLCMNTSTIRFKVLDDNKLRIRYFMYYLKSQHFKDQLFKQITGSAQLNYGPSHLKKMIMPLISLSKQDEIIACMDKVQSVIEMRRQELVKLDDLIKARFVELFGNPIKNEKHWETFKLGECLKRIDNGKSFTCDVQARTGECPAILKLSAVTYGDYRPEENKALLDEKQFVESTEVHSGDLLFTRKNTPELVGMAAYVYNTPNHLMMPDLIFRLVPNERMTAIFLWQLINNREFRPVIQSIAGGSAKSMSNISKERLNNISVICPPINEQIRLNEMINQVNKSKVEVQKALDETQKLFDSLMQQYFG